LCPRHIDVLTLQNKKILNTKDVVFYQIVLGFKGVTNVQDNTQDLLLDPIT
jgi:hypothetical protein